MNRISCLFVSLVLLVNIFACSGYKPIFSSNGSNFKIANFSIGGDKNLSKKIINKLIISFKINEDKKDTKNIDVFIKVIKNKKATSKDTAGKILEYKVQLNTEIIVKDYLTEKQILNEKLLFSSIYKIQDQYSETIELENRTTEDLLDKIFQDLLIKLSQNS